MAPCSRARCCHCSMNVGIFGVQGFGWSLRQHEARCAATSAATTVEATTTEPMLAAGLVEAATTLASRVEVAVMLLGLLTWRPGSSDAGPLCLALGMGPGDDGEILVKARPGRLPRRAPCQESALNLELLSNELPPKEHMDTNSIVNFNEDFRDIALRRCAKLQQVRKAWRPI
ncbi:NRT2.5 [Symbiodinium microadriaticum]|nr:NRT2.5 [Symbiodinium microadriaticum]